MEAGVQFGHDHIAKLADDTCELARHVLATASERILGLGDVNRQAADEFGALISSLRKEAVSDLRRLCTALRGKARQ